MASKDHEKLVLYNVLALHFYKKDNAKMIELYNKALSICDSTETMYRSTFSQSLADAYLSDGDTATAIPYYEKAIELNPKNVMALNNYAYLLCTLEQDLDKAERYAGIAVQQEPDNGTYVDTYAWVYFMKREYSLALMYIERAISLSGKNLSWEELEHYGDILFMNGRHDEAIEQWKRALEDYKENGNKPNPLLYKKVENGTYFPPHRKKSNDEKK